MVIHSVSKTKNAKKVGSVLVVGGGIGGMQASLDLANSGFKIYLLEEKPAIGGMMSKLDKTFPTNDCSMCIMSPKLVEVGRHPNIELITYSELHKVSGSVGNFKVIIRKKPRYIDNEKCTGCGECEDVCPVLLNSSFDEDLSKRHAIYKMFPQAIPNIYTIDKIGISSCVDGCPAGVDAQGYVALISQKKYEEALVLERENNPFASVCGRVCTHPCESKCSRGEFDEPIAIRGLKRFIADKEITREKPVIQYKRKEKIAVIGSGPAGLTCSYFLSKKGYNVTVFESLPVAGGMLSVGIPNFRLPRDKLKNDIDFIKDYGIEIKNNTTLGIDFSIDSLIKDGYKSIYLAIGAHKEKKLGIPGEDLDGVRYCVDFLKNVNINKDIKIGNRIAVIGGGNAAIDAARTALRLGAKEVTIVYRRSRLEMPADEEEILAAEEEGVKIKYLASTAKIFGKNNKVIALECINMKLGRPDESGRRRVIPIKDSEFQIDIDTIIPAISQSPDLAWSGNDKNLKKTDWGTIYADPITFETSIKGVFAGGDAVTGPGVIIEAISQGKEAAISIDRFINDEDLKEGRLKKKLVAPTPKIEVDKKSRIEMPKLSSKNRVNNFKEIDLGFTGEMAINESLRCLNCNICSLCKQCEIACEANAIDHNMEEELLEVNVGSIVLTPGFDKFDATIKSELGYGIHKNVLTSLEYERILSPSGPYEGHILRPSDKKEPKKIAWIQCVGSRDPHINRGYCSSVCCMYAVKEAVITKEHSPSIKSTIFYMDMRAFGKDFDKYVDRAEKEYDVRFIRSRISNIEENPISKNLRIRYEAEDGFIKDEEFDMVVLSIGLDPPRNINNLANKCGIDLNKYNFALTKSFNPLQTSNPGIFVAGSFSGPKDIPETVAQSSGVAAEVSSLLSDVRGENITVKEYPPELDVENKPARIGVFICHCGSNIAGFLNIKSIVTHAKKLPYVVYAEDSLYSCSQDTQMHIKDTIKKYDLNRVVIASCTPRTHESLFQDTIREAGLNKYLFEMANIRDQCSWVHMNEPELATDKAKDLVSMAVAKSSLLKPLSTIKLEINHAGLVIGGGLSGMISAIKLAEEGYRVYLIEKERTLGGNLNEIYYTIENEDVQKFLKDLIRKVRENKKIHVLTDAQIEKIDGYMGNFETTIKTGKEKQAIKHGVIIVATGAKESVTNEYFYGKDDRVITQRELEHRIANDNFSINDNKNVVMIQCVDSRDDNHPYCSRICCSEAVKNALKIKEINKKTNVFVLYRDIRTYGFKEDYYQKAREEGVIFIHYNTDKKPKIKHVNNKLMITVFDTVLNENIEIDTQILALSVGMVPEKANEHLSQLLKVPLNEDGFFLEAHIKLRPVDFATDGIYLAGTAHAPKFIDESISQSYAAVSRASIILSKDYLELPGTVARVNEYLCSGCSQCKEVCTYNAIEMVTEKVDGIEKNVARVNEGLCKGCGICAGSCRSSAIQHQGFKDKQILAMIKSLEK